MLLLFGTEEGACLFHGRGLALSGRGGRKWGNPMMVHEVHGPEWGKVGERKPLRESGKMHKRGDGRERGGFCWPNRTEAPPIPPEHQPVAVISMLPRFSFVFLLQFGPSVSHLNLQYNIIPCSPSDYDFLILFQPILILVQMRIPPPTFSHLPTRARRRGR